MLLAIVGAALLLCATASAGPPWYQARWNNVIDQSYRYHRHEEPAGARAGDSYRYGFPAETYRWGWFGVEHYYPTVLWHHGYNGGSVRWAYRQGY